MSAVCGASISIIASLFLIHFLQNTHYTLSHHTLQRISRLITICFVFFVPDDSIADLVHLCCVLISFISFVLLKTGKLLQCRIHVCHQLSKHTEQLLYEKSYVPSTTFGLTTLGAIGVANKLCIAFLHRDPDVGVQSSPETSKICDIIYYSYIATIPLSWN
jgi:hypothetical protein